MTPQQLKLLNFIKTSSAHIGTSPTFKEMREYMRVSSNQTIDDFLSVLEREGYISVIKGKQRGIEVTKKAQTTNENYKFYQQTSISQSFSSFACNTSTSLSGVTQNQGQINFSSESNIILEREGEKNGTT